MTTSNLPLFDQVIFDSVEKSEGEIEELMDCDVLYYYGELRNHIISYFRDRLEKLATRKGKRNSVAVCLTTPGGQAEAVEKMVEIIRHHYEYFYAIVPSMALSAGTILCMAADKIYMDYSSSLGPIDPQVPDKEGKVLVPALGYLDKLDELIEKSRNNTITAAEFALIQKQDLAMLRHYEQSRDLSIALLKQWLTRYKFKDWTVHRTTNPGSSVTQEDKERRAEEIASLLSDNKHWHSHGRFIGMRTLREIVKLEIDDFGADPALSNAVRRYSDTLSDYLNRHGQQLLVYNRNVQ